MYLLSTKWVDYVEERMKYQALRPQFFSVGGWGDGGLGMVGWVVMAHEISGIKAPIFLCGGVGGGGRVGGDGVGWVVVGWEGVVGGAIRLSF